MGRKTNLLSILACSASVSVATIGAAFAIDSDQEIADFVYNNSLFVMLHELGHVLVGEFGLPVLGREEDAVDAYAAIALLLEETEEGYQALVDAADGWALSHDYFADHEAEYDISAFYGEHSLDLQRAYAAVCMMVGYERDIFVEVADDYLMDAERQESCALTFDQALTNWYAVLEPHFLEDDEDGSSMITVTYHRSDGHPGIAKFLEQRALLEYAAEIGLTGFDLPRPVSIYATDCGEPNAFYDPEDGEVIFCYELADFFHELIERAIEMDPEE